MTAWIWALAATGYLLMMLFVRGDSSMGPSLATAVGVLWLAAALVSILAPELVTGSDPTRIPLAALIAPPAATFGTAAVCILSAALASGRA
jgi:hypothetical protein